MVRTGFVGWFRVSVLGFRGLGVVGENVRVRV